MASATFGLCGVLIVLSLVNLSASLDCYVCGKLNSGCNDPINKTAVEDYVQTCPSQSKGCLKVLHPEDENVYIRTCGVEEDCKLYNECHFCEEGLCNSSSSILPTFTVISLATGLIMRFRL